MRVKPLLFVAVLLTAVASVLASDYLVKENVSTEFILREGDNVVFYDANPVWGLSNRIVLGVSQVSGQKLSGRLLVDNCSHELDGYYKEVDFGYVKGATVRYHGPEQFVRVSGWVDFAPIASKCEAAGTTPMVVVNENSLSREDSLWRITKLNREFVYAQKTINHTNLGPVETVTLFEGPSGLFKITKLPEWDFNRIYVQVEPMDGRELNGGLYSNELRRKLSGWSMNIPVNRNTDLPFDFELAFPEYRKVKLKWWATMDAAKEELVQVFEKSLGGDSVEATYAFEGEYGKRNVKLKFRKSDFVNGRIPKVRKFDATPDGVIRLDSLKSFGTLGHIYDVHAEFKDADTITFALPLEFNYTPGEDSVFVLHQVDGKWVNIPADSVKDGFVYFRTNSFSSFSSILISIGCGFGAGLVAYLAIDACKESIDETYGGAKKFFNWVKEVAEGFSCFDLDDLDRLFSFDKENEEDDWDLEQASSLDFNLMTPVADSNHPEVLISNLPDGFKDVFDMLNAKRLSPLVALSEAKKDGRCSGSDEVCEWRLTSKNLDILLADAILAQRSDFKRRFVEFGYDSENEREFIKANEVVYEKDGLKDTLPAEMYVYKDYFKISSGLVEQAAWFIRGLEHCADVINFTGKIMQNFTDINENSSGFKNYTSVCRAFLEAVDILEPTYDVVEGDVDCAYFGAQYANRDYNILEEKNEKFQEISSAMARISLLAWLDKSSFRGFALGNYKKTYDGMLDWLQLAEPLMLRNNIITKAYASVSLYEYIFSGGSENLKSLNESLKKHYGEHGGYSEGMGYSQYIWDEVPYVLSALQDAYESRHQILMIEKNFLVSPIYTLNFSRPVGKKVVENGEEKYVRYGMIPVEIDDGCTYNPDYRVWAKLTSLPIFLEKSYNYPLVDDEKKDSPLLAFGFDYVYERVYADMEYKRLYEGKVYYRGCGSVCAASQDGISMITVVRKDKDENGKEIVLDTIALSMIAENGNLWENGQSHDQQDNLSITLTSSNEGFIIQDRGYSGFNERGNENFHRYKNHNVLVAEDYSQINNRRISSSDVLARIWQVTGDLPSFSQSVIANTIAVWWMQSQYYYNFAVEGGSPAFVNEAFLNDLENEVVGYTASTTLRKDDDTEAENHRSILYFGGSLWVIDRPNVSNLTWLANSPISEWGEIMKAGLKLYGSSDKYFGEAGTAEVKGVSKNVALLNNV